MKRLRLCGVWSILLAFPGLVAYTATLNQGLVELGAKTQLEPLACSEQSSVAPVAVLIEIPTYNPDSKLRAGREAWQTDSSELSLPAHLRAYPKDLDGTWETPARFVSSAVIGREDDGSYTLELQSGGCLGRWTLKRRVRYEDGVVTLDFPAMEYPAKRFQRLFVIEVEGEEYLLPSADVERYLALLRGKGVDSVRTLAWNASWWMKRRREK